MTGTQNPDWARNFMYLMHHAHFLIGKQLGDVLQKEGRISFSQFLVMMALDCRENPSQREIADYLYITEATVSRHIETLRKSAMITRKDNPQSRREYIIDITKKGRDEIEQTKEIIDAESKRITAHMTEEQKNVAIKIFTELIERLQIQK